MYNPTFESGGLYFPIVFNRAMASAWEMQNEEEKE